MRKLLALLLCGLLLCGFTTGYTTTPTGGAGNSYTAHFNFANGPYTMPQDGTIQSCSVFLTGSVSGTMQIGIYSDVSGSPTTLLANTSTFAASTGWNASIATTSNPLVTAGTVIWMGAVDTVSDPTLEDTNSGFTLYSGASGVSTLQTPFGTKTLQGSNFQLGAYCTFTPTAGGQQTQLLMVGYGGGVPAAGGCPNSLDYTAACDSQYVALRGVP